MKRVTVKGELDKLTENEGRLWGGFLRTHAAVTRRLDAELREAHGLSLSGYEALLKIAWAAEEGIRMSDLAEQCLMTPGGVTRLVQTLAQDRYVERHVPEINRRLVLVQITDRGFSVLQAAQRTHLAGVRTMFLSHFDEPLSQELSSTWAAIQAALR